MEAVSHVLKPSVGTGDDAPNVLAELRARLGDSPDDEDAYVVTSQAPAKSIYRSDPATGHSAAASSTAWQKKSTNGRTVFVVRTKLKLRAGAELSSVLAADSEIRGGTRVHLLQSWTLPDGTQRSCLALEGHNEAYGWISTYLDGQPNLMEEGEAAAAHAQALAAAVLGKEAVVAPARVAPAIAPTAVPAQSSPTVAASPVVAAPPPAKKKKLPMFGGGGEKCHACGKTAYQAERVAAAGYFFHIDCLRCADCGQKLGSEYGLAANDVGVQCLYCPLHEGQRRRKASSAASPPAAPAAPAEPVSAPQAVAAPAAAMTPTAASTAASLPAPAVVAIAAAPAAAPAAEEENLVASLLIALKSATADAVAALKAALEQPAAEASAASRMAQCWRTFEREVARKRDSNLSAITNPMEA